MNLALFKTDRLIVRHLSHRDLPSLTEILSDADVMRYSIGGVYDEARTLKFIDWCLACYESHGVGPWALVDKTSSNLIGFCGVGPEMLGDVEEFNLGYRLAKKYWGRGLATEAAQAALKYAFGQKQIDSVVVIIEPDHLASLRVAEKTGFQQFEARDFHGRPVRLYRLSRAVWNRLHGYTVP